MFYPGSDATIRRSSGARRSRGSKTS
jgi:hypothetical protein